MICNELVSIGLALLSYPEASRISSIRFLGVWSAPLSSPLQGVAEGAMHSTAEILDSLFTMCPAVRALNSSSVVVFRVRSSHLTRTRCVDVTPEYSSCSESVTGGLLHVTSLRSGLVNQRPCVLLRKALFAIISI